MIIVPTGKLRLTLTCCAVTFEEEILACAVDDNYVPNRIIVAKKTRSRGLLRRLSEDENFFVCAAVVENKVTEKDVLESILNSDRFSEKEMEQIQLSFLANPMAQVFQDIIIKYIKKTNTLSTKYVVELLDLKYLKEEVLCLLLKFEKDPEIIKKIISHDRATVDFTEPFSLIYPNGIKNKSIENEFEKIMLRLIADLFN